MSYLRLVTVDPSPLRRREFRLLFIGQTVTLLGTMITFVALPFQLYRLTRRSPSWVARWPTRARDAAWSC